MSRAPRAFGVPSLTLPGRNSAPDPVAARTESLLAEVERAVRVKAAVAAAGELLTPGSAPPPQPQSVGDINAMARTAVELHESGSRGALAREAAAQQEAERLRQREGQAAAEARAAAQQEGVTMIGLVKDILGERNEANERRADAERQALEARHEAALASIAADVKAYRDEVRGVIEAKDRKIETLETQQAQFGAALSAKRTLEDRLAEAMTDPEKMGQLRQQLRPWLGEAGSAAESPEQLFHRSLAPELATEVVTALRENRTQAAEDRKAGLNLRAEGTALLGELRQLLGVARLIGAKVFGLDQLLAGLGATGEGDSHGASAGATDAAWTDAAEGAPGE